MALCIFVYLGEEVLIIKVIDNARKGFTRNYRRSFFPDSKALEVANRVEEMLSILDSARDGQANMDSIKNRMQVSKRSIKLGVVLLFFIF